MGGRRHTREGGRREAAGYWGNGGDSIRVGGRLVLRSMRCKTPGESTPTVHGDEKHKKGVCYKNAVELLRTNL
eukprot:scaffold7606_cov152-Skeletonema_menzelii.AAC.4